jgi:signal transduction histidine kinase
MSLVSYRFRRPFWPVTLVSGAMALLLFLSLLLLYTQTRQWQYLALSGLGAVVVLAHGVGWWLARWRRRFQLAVWLIAAVQIAGSVLAPLFLADYWIVGLFLLAVVPIEIGIADQPRRMPMSAVITLLGASAMVATDLLYAPSRLVILTSLFGAVFLALGLLTLHIGLLGFLLWYLRLRPGARYYTRLDLATQFALVFTAISAASIFVVTGVLTAQLRTSQIKEVGQHFQTLAQSDAERVGNALERQIDALTTLSRLDSVLVEGLTATNAEYQMAEPDADRLLKERDQQWQTSPENSPFVLAYRNNEQTLALSRFRGANTFHNNIFLTDRLGGLVAAQGEKPASFYFGGEAWWQAAWHHGQGDTYLGELRIDPETKAASIFMAVGVINPQTNQIIGVLASTYDLQAIQRDISVARAQTTGEVNLLAPDGVLIAGPDQQAIGQQTWSSLKTSGVLPPEADRQQAPRPGWLMGTDSRGNAAVLAHAPLITTSRVNLGPLAALGWQVLVSDSQANALAEVMTVVVLAASATARAIARPIEALTTTAASISEGHLDQRAEPVGPVEMVTLAEAFNTLTGRLRSLINNLQDQVAQRTAQLEARVEQLAALNRIAQTLASVHDLQAALEIIAREMVELVDTHNTGIALLNESRTELTVVASYSRDPDQPSSVGLQIPVEGNPSSSLVIETGRSIIVPRPQNSHLTAAVHELMRALGIECLMVVPLLARGEVIGTIGLTTNQVGQEFTPAQMRLAETVAGQIAGAIENARLFTEMQRAKEAAEAANEAKSAFLANVSHELRTPLTSVLGFAKIIRKRLEERIFPAVQTEDVKTRRAISQVKENIAIIISEGDRLTSLINDVLDLAKIEAGRMEWHMQPLAMNEVIDQAIAATSGLFEPEALELVRDLEDGLPQVIGDRDRLVQVVINLLSNAAKFTKQGSVSCCVRRVNNQIVVSVIDTGVGVAEDHRYSIFEKFTQVGGDTLTGKPRGTGLGLPICKDIVEHHGGHIWVESELGRGSNFSFTLPCGAEASPGSDDGEETLELAPDRLANQKILPKQQNTSQSDNSQEGNQ